MSIQRQYSLPNCTILLEGWGPDTTLGDPMARPLLTSLANMECRFAGQEKPLSGGRELFEGLLIATSDYAQELLSGIPHTPSHLNGDRPIAFRAINSNLHCLTFRPQALKDDPGRNQGPPIEIELGTAQLFDLVEAIDQFYADSQTLPDLALTLAPAKRRQVVSKEPVAKQAVPMAVGISGLAVAALALFYVPAPEVRRPEPEPEPTESTESLESTTGDSAVNGASGEPPEEDEEAIAPDVAPELTDDATDPDAEETDLDEEDDPELADQEPTEIPDEAVVEQLFETAPEITDADQLADLTLQLQNQLDYAWLQDHDFEDELIYRVGVAENGDILGFRYINDAAIAHVDETPLLNLRYAPVDEDAPTQEPIGDFRVVFTPTGAVEVSPWDGQPLETGATDEEGEITDAVILEDLNWDLRDAIVDNLPPGTDFITWDEDLAYEVRFSNQGDVISVEPVDDVSAQYVDQTTLPDLVEPSAADDPYGVFLVVITANGIPQVSPWDGF